jgi:putative membrane protein
LPETIPYCGAPPAPADLWSSWNLDPLLLAALGAMALFGLRAGMSGNGRALYFSAWAMLAALFVSPLCAWSSALFSVRVAHHMVLIAAAAPLLVLARPHLPHLLARRPGLGAAFVLHTALVWLWHAPAPYAAAIESHALFWAMQISLFLSAIWMWAGILNPAARTGRVLAVLLGSFTQMGMLGALITFAGTALYAPHFATTASWGITAIEDQQLAGLIMWVPAAAPYLAAALAIMARFLDRGARTAGAAH